MPELVSRNYEKLQSFEWVKPSFEVVRVGESIIGVRSSKETSWPPSGQPNLWMLHRNKEAILIDTGYGRPPENAGIQLAWWEAGKPHVKAIITTHDHGDHTGGIEELANLVKPEVIINGEYVASGKSMPLYTMNSISIIPTPGHTKKDISVLDKKTGVLFTGDFIVGNGFGTSIGTRHTGIFLESLQKAKQLKLTAICPGHGSVIADPYEKIDDLMYRQFHRMKQIMVAISQGLVDFDDIVEEIYPNNQDQGEGQIEAHLNYLLIKKVVVRTESGYALNNTTTPTIEISNPS